MTGPENSRHFLNQSNLKPKPIENWSHVFPALDDAGMCVFTSSANWLLTNIAFHLIDRCGYTDIDLRHSIGKRSVITYRLKANFFSFYQVTYHLRKGSSLPLLRLSPKAFRSEGAGTSNHPEGLEDPPAEISLEHCP